MAETQFHYRALDARGQAQQGEVTAASAAAAVQQLQQRELTVVELRPLARAGAAPAAAARGGRIGHGERIVLLQEFATLLNAGVSIAEAAPSMAQAYAATALGAPMVRLRQALQAGRSVSDAFRSAALGLPEHAHSLIEAGEAAGRLGPALHSAAQQLEYDQGVRQQMRSALVYPSVLVGAGALAVFIIFVAVVPRFASLLGNGRAEVPALSRWIIETGLFFKSHMLACLLALAALVAAAVLALRTPAVRQALVEALARLPVTGPWLRHSEVGRWATLLATLLENRVPLLAALALSARAVLLRDMRGHLAAAQGEIRRGRALSDVLAEQGWIAATRINLIRVGERAGELPRMLGQLGQMQTASARQGLQRVLALIEPLAILLIGSVIGLIMVGVMLAITSLNTARF